MIKDKSEMQKRGLEIDLTGPDGNAYVLIGYASNLAKQLKKDENAIKEDMQSGDYEHLVEVFDREFGDYVTLYR
tara:strand:+ start:385 stop:606 length:222 start_codon:yes stop_codon:yes gene_type:complete